MDITINNMDSTEEAQELLYEIVQLQKIVTGFSITALLMESCKQT